MEGQKLNIQRLAYNEYQDSKDKSRFTSLAQKLSQHLNNLNEDKNCRIRWIWELIQNAKDVPNQFNRCKIRIEIRENKLIFAHNGDPFRVSDLESLVAQYSSKPQENKMSTETTGKYGTGFITTYILSRKVRIKGLLSMKTQEEMQASPKIEEKLKPLEDEIGCASSEEKFGAMEEELMDSRLDKKMKSFEGGSLYQRFEIYLDRDYKDRDQELYFKLMRTERNLLEDLLKNAPKPKWQRTEDDLNTLFTYEQLDEAALKMIDDSMACLKELFPYALLFNPKLSEIQMIDKRQGKKLKNFGIKRLDESTYNNMKIFNAKVLEQGKEPRTFSAVYSQDEETFSTVAMPVEVSEGKLKLLEVNHKFPKIFKQFPLIGSQDPGFNFIFTSRRFYPNETRSDLLLQTIEGRSSAKPKANWQAIQSIFTMGFQMYKDLSKIIAAGHQNLLIISLKNRFTHEDFKNNGMSQMFENFHQQMSQLKFIEFKSGKKGNLKQLVFPCGATEKNNCQIMEYSKKLNRIFGKVIGENFVLSDEWYVGIFDKIMTYKDYWAKDVTIKGVLECVSQLSKVTFSNLVYLFGDKGSALKYLKEVYEFLKQYNPSYVTQDKTQEKLNNPLYYVLTNTLEFKDLKQKINSKNIVRDLMVKQRLPKGYEEIAEQLDIEINEYTIYDDFAKYFLKVKLFGIEQMLSLFNSKFFVKSAKVEPKYLVLLGRFLTTFDIKTQFMDIVINRKNFDFVNTPFRVTDDKFKPQMLDKTRKEYRLLFQLKVMNYYDDLINTSKSLLDLMQNVFFHATEKNKAIDWLNNVYRLEEKLLKEAKNSAEYAKVRSYCWNSENFGGGVFGQQVTVIDKCLIDKNLTMSEKFVSNSQLKYFCYLQGDKVMKGNYPDSKDIAFHQKMRNFNNSKIHPYSLFQSSNVMPTALIDEVLHEAMRYKLPEHKTFKDMFEFTVKIYFRTEQNKSLSSKDKIDYLNYVYHLRQAAMKDQKLLFKIQTFEDVEKSAYYYYPFLTTNCIKKHEGRVYAFHLMKNQQELEAAMQMNEICGSLGQALEFIKEMKRRIKEGDIDDID